MHGETYNPERDGERLTTQLDAVREVMKDGQWYTLDGLQVRVRELTDRHATATSLSARIRDLRNPKFGGHTMVRRHVKNGLHEYRMVPSGQRTLFG